MLAVIAVVMAAGWGGRAAAAGGPSSFNGPAPEVVPADFLSADLTARSLPSDTPPPLREAGAWPFEELPLVIKTTNFPTPRVAIPFNAPNPVDDFFTRAVVGPLPTTAAAPAGVGAIGQAPWLLLPPVAGIAIFALDDTRAGEGAGGEGGSGPPPDGGDGGPPPPTVVPEPSTWLLVLTGLLVVGIVGLRRRGRGDHFGSGAPSRTPRTRLTSWTGVNGFDR